jgi:hypothetical protein
VVSLLSSCDTAAAADIPPEQTEQLCSGGQSSCGSGQVSDAVSPLDPAEASAGAAGGPSSDQENSGDNSATGEDCQGRNEMANERC